MCILHNGTLENVRVLLGPIYRHGKYPFHLPAQMTKDTGEKIGMTAQTALIRNAVRKTSETLLIARSSVCLPTIAITILLFL